MDALIQTLASPPALVLAWLLPILMGGWRRAQAAVEYDAARAAFLRGYKIDDAWFDDAIRIQEAFAAMGVKAAEAGAAFESFSAAIRAQQWPVVQFHDAAFVFRMDSLPPPRDWLHALRGAWRGRHNPFIRRLYLREAWRCYKWEVSIMGEW